MSLVRVESPPPPSPPRWRDLGGAYASRSLVLAGGVGLHAVNIFIVTTILPSVVGDLGGVRLYAWNTTLFVIASIVGSAASPVALGRLAPRGAYRIAVTLLTIGSLVCAAAPSMPALLAGRSLQGFGGGLLVALSYAMIRHLFPQALWPRAIAMVSGMWGAAALTGPFIGGLFAEAGTWRAAFFALLPACVAFGLVSGRVLDARARTHAGGPLPKARLGLLALAVLCVSVGSLAANAWAQVAGVLSAALLLGVLIRWDRIAAHPLFPRHAFVPTTPLGATYAAMASLVLGTSSIIFVPYFLQVIHGLPPLAAGYLTTLEALGWTGAALATSALQAARAPLVIAAGPLTMLAGLAGMAWYLPVGGADLALIAFSLVLIGAGVGMAWAHLASQVLVAAPQEEQELAGSSIPTIQLLATALGSALAGMAANAAGLSDPGSLDGAAGAARWLFALSTAAPIAAGSTIALVLIRGAGAGARS